MAGLNSRVGVFVNLVAILLVRPITWTFISGNLKTTPEQVLTYNNFEPQSRAVLEKPMIFEEGFRNYGKD
jgi:hypothetical protein